MRKHSNGEDIWAVWSMCVAVIHSYEWPKIDEAFKKDHKDDSLSKFILVIEKFYDQIPMHLQTHTDYDNIY